MNAQDLALPGSCHLWSECRMSVLQMTGSLLALADSQAGWECSSHLVTPGRRVSTLVTVSKLFHPAVTPAESDRVTAESDFSWESLQLRLNREKGLSRLEPLKPGQGWRCVSFDPCLGCRWLWLVPLTELSWKKFTGYLSVHQELCRLLFTCHKLQYTSSLSYVVPSPPFPPTSFLSLPLP